ECRIRNLNFPVGLSVQRYRLHIMMLRCISCRLNLNSITLTVSNRHPIKKRASNLESRVLFYQPFYIEQSDGCHHIPRPQLSLIFILSVTISMNFLRAIEPVTNLPHPFLTEPWRIRVVEQVSNVKVGLVAVVVQIPDPSKGIDVFASKLRLLRHGKNAIQTGDKPVLSHSGDEILRHMRNIEGVLPRIPFLEANPWREGIKRFKK